MSDDIDISGIDKAELLAALFNGSRPMGMGVFQAGHGPTEMTVEQARTQLGQGDDHAHNFPTTAHRHERLYFDYLFGRPLKVDLSGDVFSPRLYDRDNGRGAAARIIAELREQAA